MYDIYFTKHSEKQFLKLPKEAQSRIKGVLERARIRPHRHFERLVGDPSFKIRAGDYRVIADIHDKNLVLLVIELGHRRNIYKRRHR